MEENGKSTTQGTLYLCATPIGNLEDITFRVLQTLKDVDLIAAEDTRNTLKLLNHFDIHKPMTSYIAVVTDAGTPAISDPGEVLAKKCMEQGIRVTSLPGACALITGLTMSGMPARRFCFEGFLPADKKERGKVLERLREEERTVILYEAPHHLRTTLRDLQEALGDRKIVLCRELTKKFEEAKKFTIQEAREYYEANDPRGEYVLVLAGADPEEKKRREEAVWKTMSIEEHMTYYESQGEDRREAMKLVAKDRGVPKREIYRALIKA